MPDLKYNNDILNDLFNGQDKLKVEFGSPHMFYAAMVVAAALEEGMSWWRKWLACLAGLCLFVFSLLLLLGDMYSFGSLAYYAWRWPGFRAWRFSFAIVTLPVAVVTATSTRGRPGCRRSTCRPGEAAG